MNNYTNDEDEWVNTFTLVAMYIFITVGILIFL